MKTVIVTGSAGNLGQAVVNKFIAAGYRVVGTVTHTRKTSNEPPAENFVEVVVDVADENAAGNFVKDTISKYGEIAAAVLTAGGFAQGNIADTKPSDMLQQYNLNFTTAYNIAQPVFKQMIEQNSGRIFLIGSRAGISANASKGLAGYGMSKLMLFRLAELMNDEGAKNNVVASVVVPSTIDTPVNRKSMPNADYSTWVTAEAIAELIYFYTTPAAEAVREPVIKIYNKS